MPVTTRATACGDTKHHDTLPREELATPAGAGGACGGDDHHAVRVTRVFSVPSADAGVGLPEEPGARPFSSTRQNFSRDPGELSKIISPITSKLGYELEASATVADATVAAILATKNAGSLAAESDAYILGTEGLAHDVLSGELPEAAGEEDGYEIMPEEDDDDHTLKNTMGKEAAKVVIEDMIEGQVVKIG